MKKVKEAKPATAVQTATGPMTPQQAAENASRLRSVILETITETDVRHVTTTLVGRAKNGEHKAVLTFLQLVEAGPPPAADEPARSQNVLQVSVGDNNQGAVSVLAIDRAGLQVVQLLAARVVRVERVKVAAKTQKATG